MNFISPPSILDSTNLLSPTKWEETASRYVYDEEKYAAFEKDLWNRIQNYDGEFGQSMVEHLSDVATHFAGLLRAKGYDEQIALNLAQASRYHDVGKTSQPEGTWGKDERPSDEDKAIRPEHTTLGVVLMQKLLELPKYQHLNGDPHIALMMSQAFYHHERINGSGPKGLRGAQLGEPLEIMGIADCFDGKTIPRPNKKTPSAAEALREMTGLPIYTARPEKHKGEFRPELLAQAIEYYGEDLGEKILPPVAQPDPPQSFTL